MTVMKVPEVHDRDRFCDGRGNRGGIPCHHPAVWGSDHDGAGKRKLHSGRTPIKHGRYAKILRPTIRQRLNELQRLDHGALSLLPELQLPRALCIDVVE
jgi:hypothetical protein